MFLNFMLILRLDYVSILVLLQIIMDKIHLLDLVLLYVLQELIHINQQEDAFLNVQLAISEMTPLQLENVGMLQANVLMDLVILI